FRGLAFISLVLFRFRLSVVSLPSLLFFFFNAPAPSVFYTLSLHDALPISVAYGGRLRLRAVPHLGAGASHRHLLRRPTIFRRRLDRKSTRLNSSHVSISYAVFCLKKKKKQEKLITSAHCKTYSAHQTGSSP